jgi:two-component system OmpR family sensor kinase
MNRSDSAGRAPSINRRLTRAALIAVIVGALLAAAAAAFAVRMQVRDLMASSLEETAQVLVVLSEDEHELLEMTHGRVLPAAPHEEHLVWQVRTADGELLARSHQAPDAPWPAPLVEGHTQFAGLALYTLKGGHIWVQVAQPLVQLYAAQRKAALQTAGVVLACGVVASLLVALRVRHELRPVLQLARDVEAMEPDAHGTSPPRSPRRELEPVYAALEGLRQRLAEKLAAEQAFSAHAAHSLRTPLAGLTAQLEVALAQVSPEAKRRIDLAIDAARRLNGVIAALLAMGRAAKSAAVRRFAPRELAGVLTSRQIEIDAHALEDVPVLEGDIDLLSAALANLVDNAVRHGAYSVRVSAAVEGGTQRLEVIDDGPGVAPDQLARLRAMLVAGTGAELGLGLALAAAVARSHGGELTIESPPRGAVRGFAARLTWPFAATAPRS